MSRATSSLTLHCGEICDALLFPPAYLATCLLPARLASLLTIFLPLGPCFFRNTGERISLLFECRAQRATPVQFFLNEVRSGQDEAVTQTPTGYLRLHPFRSRAPFAPVRKTHGRQ